MTTDSFVVKPIRFPGGSIGELAVNGTVNDLAVAGARPLALSLSLILEEGLRADELRAEVEAIAAAAEAAGVEVVAGDTKVVERGHADSMYVCTTGVGQRRRARGARHRLDRARRPDPRLGPDRRARHRDHARRATSSSSTPRSSPTRARCGPPPTRCSTRPAPALRCMRDATRGGVASVLNELARASRRRDRRSREGDVPVRPGRRRRRRAARHRPDVRRERGQARRLRRAGGGRGGARRAARGARLRGGGGDRRGEDRAAGDGPGGDGLRRNGE